ncbi:MAG: DUF6340 family protein [Acidobacteriota bacterium]
MKSQMRFGAEMARKGNWREAIYRWEKALALEPENYRLHNNLAVACEALGRYEEAEKEYSKALSLGKNDKIVKQNYNLFMKFYADFKTTGKGSHEKMSHDASPPDAFHPDPGN